MLIPTELYSIHPSKEYIPFIRAATGDPQGLIEVCRKFDDWVSKNRLQLKEIHAESKEKNVEFMSWAREHFYLWLYNQEKKLLIEEINYLTATK